MVNIITSLLDWVQEKSKTMSGVFVLGILLGLLPSIFMQLRVNDKNSEIDNLQTSLQQCNDSVTEWQTKYYESDQEWIERFREVATFLNELSDMSTTANTQLKQNVDQQKDELNELEEWKKEVKNLKSNRYGH